MTGTPKKAISPIAAAVTAALYPGQHAVAQDDGARDSKALEEIVVTARKRSESAQDIPIAIQALSQDTLAAMGAKGMEDYARFIPSVNVVTYSNTASTIVFRGAITGAGYIAQSTSSVYLDEISITTTGSQPSVRMVDIQRVEALSGPQGTLYGSDAQAGTMRIVTNQPDPSKFETIFDGELRGGPDSDLSYRGSLVFNAPLIEDKLAIRLVGYQDEDGGFIDNVFGHTADESALKGPDFYPSGFGTLDNTDALEDRWNDSKTLGGRATLRWDINDAWSATISAARQKTESGADNDYDPFVGDLQTVKFNDEWTNDTYDLYSLTIDADLGFAQLVSATSYYERKLNYQLDVTTYAHYWTAAYCHDSAYTAADFPYYDFFTNPDSGHIVWWPVYCHGSSVDGDSFNASQLHAQQDKFTQELRLSHSGETLDWIVGLYYEDSLDAWQSLFAGATAGGDGSVSTYQDSISLAFWEWYFSNYYGTPVTYPDVRTHWYSDSRTDWEQKAVFGEATWHINDQLDLTLGGRYFDRSNTNRYFVNHPGGFGPAGEPDIADDALRQARLTTGEVPGRTGEDKEFIPKVSLSYAFSENQMAYGLFTRGKRPGGINRTRGQPFFPPNYTSDIMDNYEVGYKSNFARGKGRFNATVYHMAWSDYQLELVDPASTTCPGTDPDEKIPGVCGQPWQKVVANAGKAHISGVSTEADYRPNDTWTLGMNAEYMEAETDTEHDLNGDGINDLVKGLRLPVVPKFKASAWAEYHWPTQLFDSQYGFVRTQWSYTGDTFNILEPLPDTDPNPQTKNDAYVIGDLRVGLQSEDWEVSVFVNNLTDERAQYTHGTGTFDWGAASVQDGRAHHARIFTNRPREFGVRFMKRWGD